ncbi:hypothetical protein RZE82_00470 [Mollicutes bacterium LVI A0039]|nr:hypothetical protein RZE82_00470 [Mollicutes bacterium LVI A0039]
MNRQLIIQELAACSNQLIIDDNTLWQHHNQHDRIKSHIDGDLHDFFDLVMDNLLFKSITKQYDAIFIGEIFHVIQLHTLVDNLNAASSCLNPGGCIYIAINSNSIETAKSESSKIISRLEKLAQYTLTTSYQYQDDNTLAWTMLKLTKVETKSIDDINFENALIIGKQIAILINQGKNITKLKAGYLKSNSSLDQADFKCAYTSNQELLSIYLKSQVLELKPCFKREYLVNLAAFVFENRKALQVTADIELIKQGSFTLALEGYQRQSLKIDNQYIAGIANLIEQIWNCCLKSKLNNQLKTLIEQIEE